MLPELLLGEISARDVGITQLPCAGCARATSASRVHLPACPQPIAHRRRAQKQRGQGSRNSLELGPAGFRDGGIKAGVVPVGVIRVCKVHLPEFAGFAKRVPGRKEP